MGFLMKVALESNPEFVKLGKVKWAIAETYTSRGLDEVTVGVLPKRRGYEVRAVFRELSPGGHRQLSRELARTVISTYKGQRRRHLQVVLLKGSGWGCTAPTEVFDCEFSIPNLIREWSIDDAVANLVGRSDGQERFRVVAARRIEGDNVRAEVLVNVPAGLTGDDTSTQVEREAVADKRIRGRAQPVEASSQEAAADTFEKAAGFVWESLRGVAVRSVTLVLRSPERPNEITQEAKVERPEKPRSRLPRHGVHRPVRWNRRSTR